MEFLKKHIEKVIFAVLVLLLGVSLVAVTSQNPAHTLNAGMPAVTPREPAAVDFATLDTQIARITTQPLVLEPSVSFTSSPRRECINPEDRALIPIDATVCPFCGTEQTVAEPPGPHGIPMRLWLSWGLDPENADDGFRILDGSGFHVVHQFTRGHDPTNPNDIPALINYLRVKDIDEQRVEFRLTGTAQPAPGVFTLQLQWRYPGETEWERGFVRTGATFGRNREFHAVSFTERRVERNGRFVDESFAEIRGGRHVLQLFREGERSRGSISERSAVLTLLMGPDWEQPVRVDQTFTLASAYQRINGRAPSEADNISYMIVDIRPDAVVIRQSDAEETRVVRKATAAELQEASPMPAGSPADAEGVDDLDLDPSIFLNLNL